MRGRTRHLPRWTALGAIAAAAAAAGPGALAAPPPSGLSVSPDGDGTALARTLSWGAAPPHSEGGAVTYEGGVTTDPAGTPSRSFGSATSADVAVPEGRVWFRVRSVEALGLAPPSYSAYATIGPYLSDRTRPTIVATRSPAANPRGWTRVPTTVSFACADANPGPGAWCPPPRLLLEGAHQGVSGTAVDAVGQRASASVDVSVDLTDPAPAVPTAPAVGAVVASTRPEFAWSPAVDPLSGIQYYEVIVVGRGKVASTTYRSTRVTAVENLPVGTLQWYVRAVDNANNDSVSARMELTIDPARAERSPDPPGGGTQRPGGAGASGTAVGSAAPVPVVRPPGGSAPRPASLYARRLTPRAGARIGYLRPILRWKRGPRGTRLYNVQVFEIRGRRVRKVLTAFPKRAAYRVPRGVLRRDRRYVWRVWPHMGRRGYARTPVGVSYFDVEPKPKGAAGPTR